jgi:Na+/melibiose symporter-like transporter
MGANVGIFNVLAIGPVWGHYYDEAAIKVNKRSEGIYQGIYTFFRRISYFLMIICYTLVFNWTGYVEGSPTQTETAKLGINMLMNLIPAIAAFCAAITFIVLWTLTPEEVKANKEKLKELGI